MFCSFDHEAHGILVPQPGKEPESLALVGCLNHWTSKKLQLFFNSGGKQARKESDSHTTGDRKAMGLMSTRHLLGCVPLYLWVRESSL